MKKIQRQKTNSSLNDGGMMMPMNKLFVYFIIAAITMLFGGLIGSFFYTGIQKGFQQFALPAIFHANTIIILISSFTFQFAIRAMKRDEENNFLFGTAITFLLGVAFVAFQFLGWHELSEKGIKINSIPSGSYLYLISGLHALHFVVGIVLIGIAFVKAIIRYYDPVKELLFSTDSTKKLNVELVALYWHFVDALWVAIYLMFVVSLFI
jgi:cytochrome c oxidase subunit III